MTIKTFVEVEQSEYKAGDKVKIQMQATSQKIELYTYNNQVKTIKLDKLIPGFPINHNILSHL